MSALTRPWIALLALASMTACNSGTSPDTSPPTATPPVVVPASPTPSLSGTVRSVADQSTVSDVTVTVGGIGETKSDGSGAFRVSGVGDGMKTLTLRHPAFFDRETQARFPGEGLGLTMIPASFDLSAYEEFLPRANGLTRWTVNPILVVHRSVIDYGEVSGAAREFVVTDRVIDGSELDCMVNGIRSAIDAMSAGNLQWTRVDIADPLPRLGRIRINEAPAGAIVAMAALRLGANGRGTAYPGTEPNTFGRGVVFINGESITLCSPTAARVYPHELGHALGYGPNHVFRQPSIMGSPPANDVTSFDQTAMRAAYGRAPGNRAPDRDPDGVTVNVRALLSAEDQPIP